MVCSVLEFAQVSDAMEYLRKNYAYWNEQAEKLVSLTLKDSSIRS